jgi:hypothetical protein
MAREPPRPSTCLRSRARATSELRHLLPELGDPPVLRGDFCFEGAIRSTGHYIPLPSADG